jgi:hypothetical protein
MCKNSITPVVLVVLSENEESDILGLDDDDVDVFVCVCVYPVRSREDKSDAEEFGNFHHQKIPIFSVFCAIFFTKVRAHNTQTYTHKHPRRRRRARVIKT